MKHMLRGGQLPPSQRERGRVLDRRRVALKTRVAWRVAFRVEAFNLFNTLNRGVPGVNLSSPAFGRVTSMAGTPRILQFGVRYTL